MTDARSPDQPDGCRVPHPGDVMRQAQRFLEIVERIANANAERLPAMTERYFRRMILREAKHQLLFEEYLRRLGGTTRLE